MIRNAIFAAIAAATLKGCGIVSPAGMMAAARLDPLETSPADLSVALSVPGQLVLADGDAALSLSFVPNDPAQADAVEVQVPLSVSDTAMGPRDAEEGEAIYVFEFAPDDAARLSEAQQQIRALKVAGVEGRGSLSVGLEGGCLTAPLNEALPFATWLRTDPAEAFAQLTRPTDLFSQLSNAERDGLMDAMVGC